MTIEKQGIQDLNTQVLTGKDTLLETIKGANDQRNDKGLQHRHNKLRRSKNYTTKTGNM